MKILKGRRSWLIGATLGLAVLWAGCSSPATTKQPLSQPLRDVGRVVTTQLPSAGGSTHELTFSKDGRSLWVSQQNANRVLFISTTKAGAVTNIQELPMPSESLPHGIIAIGGGQAWLTLQGFDQLVRIDQKGDILQTLKLPAGSGPHGLAVARDGSLWYTGKTGSAVGQVQPASGQVQTWHLSANSGNTQPIYTSQAPDGSMWFTELLGSKIGRIKDGDLTEIAIPHSTPGTGSARPIAVESSPSGAIWFSLEAGRGIGYIPSSVASEPDAQLRTYVPKVYRFPIATSEGAGLTLTADGSVWAQTYFPFGLVRLHDGQLTQYTIATPPVANTPGYPVPHRLRTAPDGSLWMTDISGDRITHFVPGPSVS